MRRHRGWATFAGLAAGLLFAAGAPALARGDDPAPNPQAKARAGAATKPGPKAPTAPQAKSKVAAPRAKSAQPPAAKPKAPNPAFHQIQPRRSNSPKMPPAVAARPNAARANPLEEKARQHRADAAAARKAAQGMTIAQLEADLKKTPHANYYDRQIYAEKLKVLDQKRLAADPALAARRAQANRAAAGLFLGMLAASASGGGGGDEGMSSAEAERLRVREMNDRKIQKDAYEDSLRHLQPGRP